MYIYERTKINFNIEKVKEKYENKLKHLHELCGGQYSHESIEKTMKCLNKKLSIERTNNSQGMDKDCAIKCFQSDICYQICNDGECFSKGHGKKVLIQLEKEIYGFEKPLTATSIIEAATHWIPEEDNESGLSNITINKEYPIVKDDNDKYFITDDNGLLSVVFLTHKGVFIKK